MVMEPVSKLERNKLRGLADGEFFWVAGVGDSGADTEQSCAVKDAALSTAVILGDNSQNLAEPAMESHVRRMA
jgi:hypothetical protein